MGDGTGISWTDATWNPVRGCSRVSEGCRNCYAERIAARFSGAGQPYEGLADRSRSGSKWTGEVRLVPEHLADPLRWTKPRRIFVNSMSDLFHEKLTNEQIAAVFGVMAAAPRHTFQVLTKRATRMREWFEWIREYGLSSCLAEAALQLGEDRDYVGDTLPWPLPNVHLGVSVENQEVVPRIIELLKTPATVRFVSAEPLIGALDLAAASPNARSLAEDLDWVIAGCESGPRSRPCDVEWLRSLRDQCATASVPFFLKQAVEDSGNGPDDLCDECGEKERYSVHGPNDTSISCACCVECPEDANWHPFIGYGDGSKYNSGGVIDLPYLDGVQHAAFPTARNGASS